PDAQRRGIYRHQVARARLEDLTIDNSPGSVGRGADRRQSSPRPRCCNPGRAAVRRTGLPKAESTNMTATLCPRPLFPHDLGQPGDQGTAVARVLPGNAHRRDRTGVEASAEADYV